MAKTICKVDGCEKQRHVNSKGVVQTYCKEHQQEYWRVADERKQERKAAASGRSSVKSVGQFTDGEPAPQGDPLPMDEPEEDLSSIAGNMFMQHLRNSPPPAEDSIDERHIIRRVQGLSTAELMALGEEIPYSPNHDCEACYAKGVIEALRAKSPKLAKLIDAMEQEQRAAAELGL